MTSASPRPASSSTPSVGRAALLGLCGGLLIGGLLLAIVGLRALFGTVDCTGLGEQECDLLAEAATHVGRVQTLCGGALFSLAAALFVLARPYLSPRPAAPSPSEPSGSVAADRKES